MTMAKVIDAASSFWSIMMEMTAEARRSKMKGWLNCSRYFFHRGSCFFTPISFTP